MSARAPEGRGRPERGATGKEPAFLPYGRQTLEPDDIEAVVRALESDLITTGPEVDRFEVALAAAVGARDAVVVSNGTAALHAACFAAGVGEGDEVIVPAVTFVATANCARYLNAEPVFGDVDPDTGLMPAAEVERLVGPATRAVLPVHLNGGVADMRGIARAARKVGACVIEDAAHALGARYEGRAVGACEPHADMAIFSFHPVKHVTTGEGGAVTANDEDLLRRVRLFRDHGMERDPARFEADSPGPWYYEQQFLGHNLRMTSFQAALGLSQLAKLGQFLERRRALVARYDDALRDLPNVTPVPRPDDGSEPAHHLYPVLIPFAELGVDRGELMRRLFERGIGTQVHYIPLPMHPYYAKRGHRIEDFPGASRYYERAISLPLFPAMKDADVDRVVDCLTMVLRDLGVC